MDENFKNALEELKEDIINDYDPSYITNDVLQDRNLTEKIKQGMMYTSSDDFEQKRRFWVQEILNILPTRGNETFHAFVRHVREGCHQEHLATALEQQANRPMAEKTSNHRRSEYANVDIEEFVGLNQVNHVPKQLFTDRIRICDLNQREQIGVIKCQVIHKTVKSTSIGTLYTFFIADDSGGIDLLAKGNEGKALDAMLKVKSFYQLSNWNLNLKKIPSLSRHAFEIWVNSLPSVVEILNIPDAAAVMPFNDLKLITIGTVLFEPNPRGTVDVVGLVHQVFPKENNGQKRQIHLKDARTNKHHVYAECDLFNHNVDIIKKKDMTVILKGATITKRRGNNRLTVGAQSFIFLIDDSFDESWIATDQYELVKPLLKPKPKPRVSINAANNVGNENRNPGPSSSIVSSGSGTSKTSALLNLSASSTTPKSTNNLAQSTSRGAKRKNSFLEVDKKLKKQNKLELMLVSNVRIVEARVDSYSGCPVDNCTKKVEANGVTPYLCSGFHCKGSPMKRETKIRYKIKCKLSAGEITKDAIAFDKASKQLFGLLAVDPDAIAPGSIVEKLLSQTYNFGISGKKDGPVWSLTIDTVELSG